MHASVRELNVCCWKDASVATRSPGLESRRFQEEWHLMSCFTLALNEVMKKKKQHLSGTCPGGNGYLKSLSVSSLTALIYL